MRFVLSLFVVAAWGFIPQLAHGQTTYGNLIMELQVLDGDNFVAMSATQRAEFFNSANCDCDTPVAIEFRLEGSTGALPSEEVQVWVGSDCANMDDVISEIESRCNQIDANINLDSLRNGREILVETTAKQMMFPDGACGTDERTNTIFAFVDEGDDRNYEAVWTGDMDDTIIVDTEPPVAVETPVAAGGETTVRVEWDLPESGLDDYEQIQILCADNADGSPLLDSPSDPAAFSSAVSVCGAEGGTGIDSLDPRYICGTIGGTAEGITVNVGDQNTSVDIRILVIDDHENATVVTPDPSTVTLVPVIDFWEYYGQSGGTAQSGFCSVAAGPTSKAPHGWAWLLVFLLGGYFVARKSWRRLATLTVIACCLMGSNPARAQLMLDEEREEPRSNWAIELKFGPYMPDIDSDLGSSPYEDTFGGSSLISMLELDYYFAFPEGMLGLGLQLGYFSASAKAFADGGGTVDPTMRSDSENTTFRVLPTSLSLVYRFTSLAERTPIPLVPYGKLGLSYYMWWVYKGDGNVAENPTGGKGQGGSLGYQATLGLALRLGFLDPSSSRSLEADYGIENTTFFGEILYANVNGFGSNERLAVGDTTWLLGLGFEF